MTDDEEETPSVNDVLLGRGSFCTLWKGNVYFRQIVSRHRVEYQESARYFKSNIASKIKSMISSLNPPGRFLKKNNKTGRYNAVCRDQAIEKICQALREKIETKSSANSTAVDDVNNSNAPSLNTKKRPKVSHNQSILNEIYQKPMNAKLLKSSKSIAQKPAISRDDIFFSPTNRAENSNNNTRSSRFSYATITPGDDFKENRVKGKTLSNSAFSDNYKQSTTPRRAFNEISPFASQKLSCPPNKPTKSIRANRNEYGNQKFSNFTGSSFSREFASIEDSNQKMSAKDRMEYRREDSEYNADVAHETKIFSDINYQSTTPRRAFNEISPFALQNLSCPSNKSMKSIRANRNEYGNQKFSNFTGSSFTREFASIEDSNQKMSAKDRMEYRREGSEHNAGVAHETNIFKVSKTETSFFENNVLAYGDLHNRSPINSMQYYNHYNGDRFQTKQASERLEQTGRHDSKSFAGKIYSNQQQESWNNFGSFMNHDLESLANTRSYSSFERSSSFQPIYEHRYLAAAAGFHYNIPSRDVIQNSISPLTINSNIGDEIVVSEQQRQTCYLSESQSCLTTNTLGCTPLSWLGPSVGETEHVLNSFNLYCEYDKERTETDTNIPHDVIRTV